MSDFLFGFAAGVCATVCAGLLIDAGFGACALRRKLRDRRR